MTPETRADQTHLALQNDLKAYTDGELPLPRRIAVRRHLSGCAACREEIEAMQRLRQELRSTEPTAGLDPALKARILSQVAAVPPLPAPRRPDRLLRYGFAASVAVSLAFAMILLRTGVFTGRPLPAPPQEGTTRRYSAPQSVPAPVKAKTEDGAGAVSGAGPEPTARQLRPPVQDAPAPKPAPAAPTPPPPTKAMAVRAPGGAPGPMAQAQGKMRARPAPSEPTAIDTVTTETPRSKEADAEAGLPKAPEPSPIAAQASQPLPAPPPPPAAPPSVAAPPETPPASRAFARQSDALPATAPPVAGFAPAMSDRVSTPKATDRDTPKALNGWPPIHRPAGVAGAALTATVEANWQVDAQGRASDVHFLPTGDATVDEAIRDAIRKNHFIPASHAGSPVSARMSHTFVIAP